MKISTITSGIISVAIASLNLVNAADVTYSVVAFPGNNETVAVNVANQDYPLQPSQLSSNLFTGVAPNAPDYHYTYLTGSGAKPETVVRHLADSATATGNEFFNRSRTVYDVPALPKAYNDIYPALQSAMSNSNEISTIIINADMNTVDKFMKNPMEDNKFAEVYNMSYISHDAVYSFQGAGIKNSGQSSKELAKQSLKIKFNKFNNATKDSLFGRRAIKLRAEANDPTMAREKLMLDSLAAAGVATLNGNWVRLVLNNTPYGLYLMTDDTYKGFTENLLNGGNVTQATGVTYKGNAMDEKNEANLVYKGNNNASYNFNDVYILEDEGRDKNVTKDSFTAPIINFMERLNNTVAGTDAQNPGTLTDLIDSANHTMIHLAMSFLSGSWDGIWRQASNFYLNENLDTKKWYVISYDFDETFGNGLEEPELLTVAYQNYSRAGSQRPLVDAFIKSPYYEPIFQDILKNIVQTFFNPRVLKPRLDAWTEMLKEDVEQDYALPYRSPGEKRDFDAADFAKNMYSTVGDRIGLLEWISNRTEAVAQQLNFNINNDAPAAASA
ncbi:hypothetical protein MBANPS3_004060 [Mucor bainieri]